MKPLTHANFLLAYSMHFLLAALFSLCYVEVSHPWMYTSLRSLHHGFVQTVLALLYAISWLAPFFLYFFAWGNWNERAQKLQMSASTYHDQISWRYRCVRFLFPNCEE